MAAREIVISLRLTEGTTREQFRALKAALIDVRTEVAANNNALKANAKEEAAVQAEVKKSVEATQAQKVALQFLKTEREGLKTVSANLALSEAALGTQYKAVQRDLLNVAQTTDKLRIAQIASVEASVRQKDALGAATEKAKQLATVANQLFAAFKKGEGTAESFNALNAALIDTRAALTANNAALKANGKAEAELAQEVRLAGVATEDQAASLNALAAERVELQAVNSSLKVSEGQLSGVLREVGNDVKGLTDAGLRFRDKMADANREAIKQSSVLQQLGARMDFLRAEQDRLNQEQAEGKITSEQYRAALDKLSTEERETAAETAKLTSVVDRLSRELAEGKISSEQFRSGIAGIDQSVKGVGTAVNAGVSDLKNFALGFVGVVAVAQGAITAIKAIGKTISGFQQANTNLAAILGTTRDKITELTDSAIKIGPAFGRAPEAVTELQTELAKLGFTVPEIIAAQEAVILLANATGEELGKSAEVAAATLNGFNLEASETGRVVDVITEAANRSSLDLEKFSVAMATVAPAANQAGFSIEETTALIGVLSDRGLDASTAGTALRSMFIDLAKTGQTFEQAMAEINGSTNKTGTAFKLFGERAAGAAVILAEAGTETDALTEALNNAGGAAEKVATQQLDTLAGSVDKLAASWDGFVLSIDKGDGIISRGLKAASGALTQFLNILSGSDEFANFKNDLDSIAEASGLGTSGLGDTKPVKAARDEVGLLLKEVNDLSQGITRSVDELGNLTEIKIAPADLDVNYDELFGKITKKIEDTRKASADGLIDADVAKGQIGALEILIKDRLNPAYDKLSALQEEAAKGSAKVGEAAKGEGDAVETLAAKRARLTEELASEKAFQDGLAATDTAGIERSKERVKALDAQLSVVSGSTKSTKEQTEAEREKTEATKELTKAEEDRTRSQLIAAQAKTIQQADPTITAPQAQAEAAVIVDSTERVAKAQGDAVLIASIEADLQEKLKAIREKAAVDQVAAQDKANADLRARNAALAQNELDALIDRQNAELILAAQNGEDVNALATSQAQERIALTQQIEDAAIEAKLESFDAEFALAETNGTDLLALTQTQQEELAALKASFRDDELTKQVELNDAIKTADQALMQAKIDSAEQLGTALIASAKEGSTAAKIGLALQKASAIAQILINLQLEKSAIEANPAYNLLPDNGQVIKNTLKAFATVRAGFSIATVLAQAIQGFATGGEVDAPSRRGVVTSSWGRPIRRKNGDNVLVTLKKGEKVLNEDQQEELEEQHGKDVWGRIGLPGHKAPKRGKSAREIIVEGFAGGGTVGGGVSIARASGLSASELNNIENNVNLTTAIGDIEMMVSVTEINKVQSRLAQVTELARG